jgi:hypothetical protein
VSEEGERVVGKGDERHAGEEGGIERQHALRRTLVLAVTQCEQACAQCAEIDHEEKERRERIEPEMRAEPGHAERQRQFQRRRRA